MITFQAARQIAETAINKQQNLDDVLIIINEQIIEKDYVWIFPYTSKKFTLVGNRPLFVSKLDGKISNYVTSLSLEDMIDKYNMKRRMKFGALLWQTIFLLTQLRFLHLEKYWD